MSQTTFSFRVDTEIKEAFSQAAQGNDCSPSQLLRDFMRQYVSKSKEESYDAWFRAKVEEGLADIEAGRVVPHDEVMKRAKIRREELLSRKS